MTGGCTTDGLALVRHDDPVLLRPADDVPVADPGLVDLIEEMFDVMYTHQGVGLAAPQVGIAWRLFVFDCPDSRGLRHRGYVVNPVLAARTCGEGLIDAGEGCLSLPGMRATVPRAEHATVTGMDARGEAVTVEGDGLLARCLQHETDHLDGRLFVSRLPARERRALLDAFQEGR